MVNCGLANTLGIEMNERIKELLYEAGGQYRGEHFITGKTVICTEEVDYEKFAELIVEECASICYKSSLLDADAHAQNLLYEFNIDNCRDQK